MPWQSSVPDHCFHGISLNDTFRTVVFLQPHFSRYSLTPNRRLFTLREVFQSVFTVKENTIPSFDLSTYRAYISKALRKKKLSPEQLVELQHRVDAMIAAKVEMKQETIEKLKAIGITVD